MADSVGLKKAWAVLKTFYANPKEHKPGPDLRVEPCVLNSSIGSELFFLPSLLGSAFPGVAILGIQANGDMLHIFIDQDDMQRLKEFSIKWLETAALKEAKAAPVDGEA
jgi:hypothetical protein